mgnify:CR=1 FL=1
MQELKPVAMLTAMESLCLDAGGTAFVIPAGTELPDDDCTALYALPATHRIVPVELLRLWIATADEMPPKLYDRLRAIIDKEPT